jgi:tmRNA-binding protein
MIILKNKKATFNYEILQKYSAGISLYGFEVKSIKNKKASFEGAFISISNTDFQKKPTNKKHRDELFLKNFSISPYQEKNTPD